jgi:hypothetical protein
MPDPTANSDSLFSILFPENPRDFPFRRGILMTLRVLHILMAGILLGGHVFDRSIIELEPWLWGTVISGLLILLTDMYASLAILLEVRGLAVLIKVILMLLTSLFWEQRITLLVLALIVGVFSSHMPKKYRHRLLFFSDRIVTDNRSG